MTHEELLAKMAQIAHTKDANEARNDYLLALRAVVELHKPMTHCELPNCPGPVCSVCGSKETLQTAYPCPTIQAIERELA